MTLDQVAEQPDSMINPFFAVGDDGTGAGLDGPARVRRDPYTVPEREDAYPEASMFGLVPAWGFFIRHARGIEMSDVEIHLIQPDERPPFVIQDVDGIDLVHVRVHGVEGAPVFALRDVTDFRVALGWPMGEVARDSVADEVF